MLIQLIQHYEDGNKTRFAKRLGLTPQGVSTWLSRGTIDYELVYAKCEHLNAEWLLTGRGSMLRKDVPTPSEPVSAPSDAIAMRLMDKLDQKDAENKHLQSELLSAKEELAAFKAKYPEFPTDKPVGLGSSETAPHAHSHPHSPTSEHYHGGSLPPQENQ